MLKKIIAILSCSATLLLNGAYQAPGPEISVKVKNLPQSASAAKWLWFQADTVAPHETARYRRVVNLPPGDAVVKAEIKVGLDDAGDFYCNGKKLNDLPYPQPDFQVKFRKFDLRNVLKSGRNILALEARNDASRGGLIMRGVIELASGRNITIVSDSRFKAVRADKSNVDFFKAEYDDSAWQPAMAFGDVSASPWNRVSDVFNEFTSDSEKKSYYNALAAVSRIPAAIAREPQSRAEVVYLNDMAALKLNGRIVPAFTWIIGNDPWNVAVGDQLLKLNGAGLNIFEYQTQTNSMFRGSGEYDFSFIDRDVRRILSLAPQARLIIALRFDLFRDWMKEHPDELIGYVTGKADSMSDLERRRAPSMASHVYRAEMQKFIKAFMSYLQKQIWYKRLIGIRVSQGVFSEWHYYGMAHDMPDTGKAMTAAFRDFLRKKYQTNDALAAAWKTPGLTFDTATVPDGTERRGQEHYLRDPSDGTDRKVMDYYLCHSQVVADMLLAMAGAVKASDRKLLVGAYYGYCFGFPYPAEGSTLELEKVLSSPDIDFLSAPFCYDAESRNVNGDGLSRSVNYSFRRHGKLFMYEADTRTHLTRQRSFGNARTPRESVETLKRNFAQASVAGSGLQMLDLERSSGNMWFNHPEILTAVNASVQAYGQAFANRRSGREDIAVVFNPLEILQHDRPDELKLRAGIGKSLTDNALHALNRSGYTYDLMTLHDYLADDHKYAVTVFLNTFTLSAAERAQLKKRSRNADSCNIWIYAAGLVTEQGLQASGIEDLTGIKAAFALEKSPMSASLPDSSKFSVLFKNQIVHDSPLVWLEDPQAEVLAHFPLGQAAAAVKMLPDNVKSIFSALPVTTPEYWRKLLALTPAEVVGPAGLVISKSGNLTMVYAAAAGEWKLRLPEDTVDLFGAALVFDGKSIVLKSDGPKCFLLLSK